jgi:DUF4097 and DUF4098 domain-containing protein YvlB
MYRYVLISLLAILGTMTGCVNADDSHSRGGADNGSNSDQTSESDESHSVNGSIHVKAGQKKAEVSTVNGSIHIDDDATVGGAETVNGSVGVGAHATADSAQTVNGRITLAEGATVLHTVSAVNGALTLHTGADVGGTLSNVNGHIILEAAHVGGGIKTVSGDIDVGSNSHVEGGILVEKAGNEFLWFFHWSSNISPRIVIGPGSVVQGDLHFKRQVRLFVSEQATIGPVSGATAVRFSGASPPK